MAELEPKRGLLRAISSGKVAGARLRDRANPTTFVTDEQRRLVREELGLAVRLTERDGSKLWVRERAASAVRAAQAVFASDPSGSHEVINEAARLSSRLDEIDRAQFEERRARLARGDYGAKDLELDLADLKPVEIDPFVSRLFEVHAVPSRETERIAGMVHYLPSPFRSIRELAVRLGSDDLFVDVGSGLGLVPLLVAWLSGARTRGVEIEPAYHRRAEEIRARFPSLNVELVLSDCRAISYADATFVYVYDTIRDSLLDELLARIRSDSSGRVVRFASRGMSTPAFDRAPWLEKLELTPSEVAIYRSV